MLQPAQSLRVALRLVDMRRDACDSGATRGIHFRCGAASDSLHPRARVARGPCILGVKDVIFLGHCDGVVEPTIALRRDLTRVMRHWRPAVVGCGDPTVRYYGTPIT